MQRRDRSEIPRAKQHGAEECAEAGFWRVPILDEAAVNASHERSVSVVDDGAGLLFAFLRKMTSAGGDVHNGISGFHGRIVLDVVRLLARVAVAEGLLDFSAWSSHEFVHCP